MTRLIVGPSKHCRGGYIRFGLYGSGEYAMQVVHEELGEVEGTATVSLLPYGAPDPRPGLWLKGWSENIGLPEALVEAGIVTLTGRVHTLDNGCIARHALLTPDAHALLNATIEGANV